MPAGAQVPIIIWFPYPLLANIALHGMESAVGVAYQRHRDAYWIKSKRALVRYADDFVIFAETREDAEAAKSDTVQWLASRGLDLSREKTRICHLTEGFNFLGFNVRQYPVPSTKTGYKLLIKPSKESVAAFKYRMNQEWSALVGHNVNAVLNRLRPLLRGWANDFRSTVSTKTFNGLDHWMFYREAQWCKRAHPTKPWKWIGRADKTNGYLEIPRQGITCPYCRGRLSDDTSWFATMRRQITQTCAPTGNSERPGKQSFFRPGDNGDWQGGREGNAQCATTACTTMKNSMFITLSPSPRAGRTQSQTSRWYICTVISKLTNAER